MDYKDDGDNANKQSQQQVTKEKGGITNQGKADMIYFFYQQDTNPG